MREKMSMLREKKNDASPNNTIMIPIIMGFRTYLYGPATTSEVLAKYIHDKLKEIYKNKKIKVKVGESKSSIASYEE